MCWCAWWISWQFDRGDVNELNAVDGGDEIKIKTIDEMTDIQCREWTRFEKPDIQDLHQRLRLPEVFEIEEEHSVR